MLGATVVVPKNVDYENEHWIQNGAKKELNKCRKL
jgi:hypothetical protein